MNEIERLRERLSRATQFEIKPGRYPDQRRSFWIQVQLRRQMDGSEKWVVFDNGLVLTKKGRWKWEPTPSSRTDAFIRATRFDSLDEAWDAAERCSPHVPELQPS